MAIDGGRRNYQRRTTLIPKTFTLVPLASVSGTLTGFVLLGAELTQGGARLWRTYPGLFSATPSALFRRHGRRFQRLYAEGLVSSETVKASLRSWNAHAATADSFALRRRVMSSLTFVKAGSG